MNDKLPDPEEERAAAPYLRLPMPVVAIGLFVFLAALLAVGLYANLNLRPRGIVTPTPAVQTLPSVTPLAVAAAPTSTTAPAPLVATTQPTPLILIVGTPTALPLPSTLMRTATIAAAVSESSTPLPTVDPTLAAEVGKAYENFWRVKSQALLNLDPTNLPEVMDGEYLMTTVNLIDELRSEGHAIKTQVSLDYTVVQVSVDSAEIVDFFVDNSIYVKPGTEDPLSSPVADQLSVLYRLHKLSQVWKVVESDKAP